MAKRVLGVVAGVAAWMLVTTAAGMVLRAAWPEYVAASGEMTFTLPMQIARLALGALATVAAGLVTGVITRSVRIASLFGILLLLVFIPVHVNLWERFPIWYHLTFLASLVPLAYLGGRTASRVSDL
jgi:hypothetical protein